MVFMIMHENKNVPWLSVFKNYVPLYDYDIKL